VALGFLAWQDSTVTIAHEVGNRWVLLEQLESILTGAVSFAVPHFNALRDMSITPAPATPSYQKDKCYSPLPNPQPMEPLELLVSNASVSTVSH
jgi:hypothetical protein